MGYHRKKVYVLEFVDPEYRGLEVRMRPVTIGELLEITELGESSKPEALRELFTKFAGALVSWNLEDEFGQPVPANLDGVLSQDADLIDHVIGVWQNAASGKVSGPKEQPSSVGLPSQVVSLPTEILYPSQAI